MLGNGAAEGLAKWREEGCPVKSRQEKFDEKPTRKRAMDLFCLQCMGGEDTEGVRVTVRDCTSPKCPLFIYRPYK